ncbi:MAG: CDP-glucose 4,6-dehydratase [Deltaproteobacteria bacterium]|nr:CDP-glucose 4,6-dehydratase [Deltaproteobacteria bacterium]
MSAAAPSFFRDRPVLVTGHTGFKGGWLVRWLSLMGARVTGFALPPEAGPNLFELGGICRGIEHVVGDLRDLDAVLAAFRRARPEIVLHLGAQALVRRSYRQPVETYATNVMGTVHVLDACRLAGTVKALVVVTSDKCYENREWEWGYREDEPMGGHDPYSSSKGCAELVVSAYRRSFLAASGTAVATGRAGNVIGGGDFAPDRIVPDIVRGAAGGEPVAIRNPGATRPWQHVLDPLAGYLLLARRLCEEPAPHAGAWNFGPADAQELTVGELAGRIVARLGRGRLELPAAGAAPDLHEARFLKLDPSKARARLGWKPRLGIDQAVELTARWYRLFLDDPPAAGAELDAQIHAYGEWFA